MSILKEKIMYFNKRKTQIKLSIQKKRKLPKIYFFKKFSFLKRKKIKFFILSKNYLHIELKFYKVFVKKIRKIAKKKEQRHFFICAVMMLGLKNLKILEWVRVKEDTLDMFTEQRFVNQF